MNHKAQGNTYSIEGLLMIVCVSVCACLRVCVCAAVRKSNKQAKPYAHSVHMAWTVYCFGLVKRTYVFLAMDTHYGVFMLGSLSHAFAMREPEGRGVCTECWRRLDVLFCTGGRGRLL